MGESFQDYSWIQDFGANFLQSRPQNPELSYFQFILRHRQLKLEHIDIL